jgi:hypothetical protein
MIIGWVAMLVFVFYSCTHMVAAGDTWVAMACGRHFVNHGVDTVEPFSAYSHKAGPTEADVKTWPKWAQWVTSKVGLETVRYWHPTGWVNQNWLTHVIFYKLTTSLGSEQNPYYDALVLWKFAIYVLAAACIYFTARIYGVNRALAVVFVCFAMVVARSFLDIRPAGLSNLLVAAYLLVLTLATYRHHLYVWLLVPLVVFWSNVHGGYIYAFLMLVPFVTWHAIVNLPKRWGIAAYGILTWLALYGMANRFLHHQFLKPVPFWGDGLFYLLVLAIAGSLVLAALRRHALGDGGLAALHLVASCILFLAFLIRFFPAIPLDLGGREEAELSIYFGSARLAYLGVFAFAMLLGAVLVFLREKVVRAIEPRGIVHTIGAGVVAFVAMVVFNPFHLTNLTHTLEISVSKHAERWRDVHEWRRAFDWSNPVGTAVPFLVMFVLAWLVLVAIVVLFIAMSRWADRPVKRRGKTQQEYSGWPRIDFAMVIVAAMTIYMAIRSRRFIPIAGFAACPLIALLVDQIIRGIAALARWDGSGKLEVPQMPVAVRHVVIVGGTAATLFFGLYWGWNFKYVYLDSWPPDPQRTSVFMRLTDSPAKPFEACEFIRKNHLRGKMFNYWTEGGFIAWGEDPDPNTGRTPLQLFMDGRAQAAYSIPTFDRWTLIMSGGPVVHRAVLSGRQMDAKDYLEVGTWISEELRKQNVWVVLMPANQFDSAFVKGLEQKFADWPIVFLDDRQKLFVDVNTPQGKALYDGVFTGRTVYPNEFAADLSLGHNLLLLVDAEQRKRGLDLVMKAFESQPSPTAMIEMLLAGGRFPELTARVDQECAKYTTDFAKNKQTYARQDGYNLRLESARLALMRLEHVARSKPGQTAEDRRIAEACRNTRQQYEAESLDIAMSKRW